MTFFFDVLPAMIGTALSTAMAGAGIGTVGTAASAAGAAAAVGSGAGAAFGAGLSASALTGLGFTSGVVGATTAGTGLAAAGATAGLGITASQAFMGISAATSLLKASGIMDKKDPQASMKDVAAIEASTQRNVGGENQMKKLKAMVAGRNRVKPTRTSGLLSTATEGGQKLGSA